VRLIVEPNAAAVAAQSARSSDLKAIAEAHVHTTEALQHDEFEHWDTLFHQRLFAATRNELLSCIHGILQGVYSRRALIELQRKYFYEDRRRDYCTQHANVITALANRDAHAAAKSMLQSIKAIELALFATRSGA
jgi:DNA-binding FadR family transcriptional regulator